MPWRQVSGRASILSWAVPHPPVLPAFAPLLPFAVVLVELDEGPRLIGQLLTSSGALATPDDVSSLTFAAQVVLTWRDQDGQWLPGWSLAS